MTATLTAADYARKAQEAIAAKDAKSAMEYIELAKATKAMSQLDTAPRLDFGDGSAPAKTAQSMALKAWYSEAFGGDLDHDGETLMKDLYGSDVRQLAHAKSAGFYRYLRTGAMDSMAHKVVMTPAQVMKLIADGQDYASIKATQVESQDQLGGYLVPEDFRDKVVERIQGLTPMRGIADTITTSRDRVTMPVITGGDDQYTGSVRVFKVDESPTSTQAATDARFGSTTIPVYTIMGHAAISKDVLEDTTGATSIMAIMQRQFASAYSVFEDREFLTGNGIAGPQGILKDATTGGPYTFAYGTVTTVNSGAATALTADSIRALPYGVATQYRQAGGMWLMSRGTLRVIKSLKAGDGTYLWSSRGDTPALQNGAPASLEGFPIMETETLPSPTTNSGSAYTAGTYPIVFITRPMYTIVDKMVGGMAVERYDDSTTAKANQVVLVIRRRVGGQVVNPWAGAVMKISA
jgi:HK97 family phage major capsid protein